MAQTVDPRMWHYRSQVPFSQVREASKQQKALYQDLLGMVRDPLTKLDLEKYAMPSGWTDAVKNEEALRRTLNQVESG